MISNLPIINNLEHSNILIKKNKWILLNKKSQLYINNKLNFNSKIYSLYKNQNNIEGFYRLKLINSNETYFLKIINNNNLKNQLFANKIGSYLLTNKIKAPVIKKKIIDKKINKVFILYDYIEGKYVNINNKNIYLLGSNLYKFHKVIKKFSLKFKIKENSDKKIKLFKKILNQKYINNYKFSEKLMKVLKNPKNKLYFENLEKNQQIIHGDLNYKNLLMNKDKEIIFLDFEDMQYSYHNPLLDLATIIERFIMISKNKNKKDLINSLLYGYFGNKSQINYKKKEIYYLLKSFSLKSILTLIYQKKQNDKIFNSEIKKFIKFYTDADKFLLFL